MYDQAIEVLTSPVFSAVIWPIITLIVGKFFPQFIPVLRGADLLSKQLVDLHDKSATPNRAIAGSAKSLGHTLAMKAIAKAVDDLDEEDPEFI